jgi:dUTPase
MGIKLVKYAEGWGGDCVSFPYFIFPRSSIWKKPLRLANSTGIIDSGYRGEIGVALDNIRDEPFVIEKGWRLDNNLFKSKLLKYHFIRNHFIIMHD